MEIEKVTFPSARSTTGIELEGRLHVPDGEGPFPGVLICHPHPAGGGSQDVPLLFLIAERLSLHSIVALRFNFGGVGTSGGSFTDGAEEPADVTGARDFLAGLEMVDGERLGAVGWSFGAWMCMMAEAEGLGARVIVAIAPPLLAYDCHPVAEALGDSAADRHYIVGSGDQFCSIESLQDFTGRIAPEEPGRITVLPGTDHFLSGSEEEIASLVVDRLSDLK